MGVASGPLSATKLRLTLEIASSGMTVLPSELRWGVTSTDSHLMGVLAAEKMSLTDWEICCYSTYLA